MRTERGRPARREGLRRLAWFVALWAAGMMVFAIVTGVLRALLG
jgi:fatty acid desaturase